MNVVGLGRLEDGRSPNSLERSLSPDNRIKNNVDGFYNNQADARQQRIVSGGSMIN